MEEERVFVESLLANKAFDRFVNGLLTYQKLLGEAILSEERTGLIERMRALYSREGKSEEAKRVTDTILGLCESGELSKEKLAQILLSSTFGKKILESFNPKPGRNEQESGKIYVNEVMAYDITPNHHLVVHIIPTPVSGSEVLNKTIEGFRTLVQEMKIGKLRDATQVDMESWLFYHPKFKPLLEAFLGDSAVEVHEMIPDDEPTAQSLAQIQQLALQFNQSTLETYLRTGQKPRVGVLNLSQEKFIEIVDRMSAV